MFWRRQAPVVEVCQPPVAVAQPVVAPDQEWEIVCNGEVCQRVPKQKLKTSVIQAPVPTIEIPQGFQPMPGVPTTVTTFPGNAYAEALPTAIASTIQTLPGATMTVQPSLGTRIKNRVAAATAASAAVAAQQAAVQGAPMYGSQVLTDDDDHHGFIPLLLPILAGIPLWILKRILRNKKKVIGLTVGKKIAQHIPVVNKFPGLKPTAAVAGPGPMIMKKKKKGLLRKALGMVPLAVAPVGAGIVFKGYKFLTKGKKPKYAQQQAHGQPVAVTKKKSSLPVRLIKTAIFGKAVSAALPKQKKPKSKLRKFAKLPLLGLPLLAGGAYFINKTAKKGSEQASAKLGYIPEANPIAYSEGYVRASPKKARVVEQPKPMKAIRKTRAPVAVGVAQPVVVPHPVAVAQPVGVAAVQPVVKQRAVVSAPLTVEATAPVKTVIHEERPAKVKQTIAKRGNTKIVKEKPVRITKTTTVEQAPATVIRAEREY